MALFDYAQIFFKGGVYIPSDEASSRVGADSVLIQHSADA